MKRPSQRLVLALLLTLGMNAAGFSLTMLMAAQYPAASALPANSGMPDPLVLWNGTRVTAPDVWTSQRRPELKELFQHYMYGPLLPAPARLDATMVRTATILAGKATLKEISIGLGVTDGPRLHLLLVVPNGRTTPAPVFVGPNFCGNHAVLDEPGIRIPPGWIYGNYPGVTNNRATVAGRGRQADVWAVDQVVDRGYSVATFYNGDVEPDLLGTADGITASYRKQLFGITDTRTNHFGTIAAWGWAIHRAVDYLVTDPDIDPKRIAAVGHSRNGKAALVAAAFDERIALAIPHQAGCGGTAPSRGRIGESVKQINDRFPHWFNAAFKQFNDAPERLPFDQNGLVALVAPRPVLFSNATEDTWANPAGQFDVLKAADPVYRLLGLEGLGADQMPPTGRLLDSRLGYFIRPGKHSMNREDWNAFLDFADRHFGRPRKPGNR